MAEYIAEQMIGEMLHQQMEEPQQTEQLQGGLDSYDQEFMAMLDEIAPKLEEVAPLIMDDNIDEEEFDARLEELFPDEPAEEVIEQLEEAAKLQQEQADSAFGAGVLNTVIDGIGNIGVTEENDEDFDTLMATLKSAEVEEDYESVEDEEDYEVEEMEEEQEYVEELETDDSEDGSTEEGVAEEIVIA